MIQGIADIAKTHDTDSTTHEMADSMHNEQFDPDARIDESAYEKHSVRTYDPDERINVGNVDSIESDSKGEIVEYLITRNESLENDVHPITGVPFFRRQVELPNGEKKEGVFPEFNSLFNAKVDKESYLDTDKNQFKECNRQLLDAIEKDPGLKNKFSNEQIEQIKDGVNDGTAPDGYVWHHDAEPGRIQLVDAETHAGTGHTGGRAVWGGGSDNR